MGSKQGKPELDTHDDKCTAGRYKVGKGRRRAFIVFRRMPLRILRAQGNGGGWNQVTVQ